MTSTDAVRDRLVTPEMREQYRNEGYFVLERVLTDEQLELLRSGAQFSIDKLDAAMDEAGTDSIGINARGKRYFSNMIYQDRPELRKFLFSDTMAEICQATLGERRLPLLGAVRHQGGRPGHGVRLAPGLRLRPRGPRALRHLLDHPRRRHRGERLRLPAAVLAVRHQVLRQAHPGPRGERPWSATSGRTGASR